MSCFLIGAGVAWFPGAVRPSPAAKARKQVVKIKGAKVREILNFPKI